MNKDKIDEVLKIYNQIIDLNKKLDVKVESLNLNEFTEFMILRKHLKIYKSKLYN